MPCLYCFFVAGCAAQGNVAANREFYFSSGGAYHFQGYGEWTVTLNQSGSASITHTVQGNITDYETFTLSAEENSTLWRLIDAAKVGDIQSPERFGLPDEVQQTLALTENGSRHEVQVWIGEVQSNENLIKLVDQIEVLIQVYTGQQAVLK